MGFAAVRIVNRINLDAAGLYPILISAFSLLTFGLASWLGGSGFLAVYLAGIVIGNSSLVFQRGIRLFHDAAAWLAQIVMFVVLGLLSFPGRLLDVGWQGLAVGAVLIFLARPLAVVLSTVRFGFDWRELALLSWVGLKGAVPITLATFPLMFGTPGAEVLFDVVFFVVVLSALVQGWSLPQVARRLGIDVPTVSVSPVTLEISSLRHVDGDIVDYTVGDHSRAANRLVKELALPEGVVIALVARHDEIIPPQGNTRIEPGDHVILVLRPEARPLVNQVFASTQDARGELPFQFEFPLRGTTTVGELEDFYDIRLNVDRSSTLDEAIRQRLTPRLPVLGAVVQFSMVALRVRNINEAGQIEQVGMSIVGQAILESSTQVRERGNPPGEG